MAAALPSLTDCCNPCDSCALVVVIDGGGGGGGPTTPLGWFKVKSLTEARAIPWATTNVHVEINGNQIGGDGFLGSFDWDVNDNVNPDDGAGYLQASDDAGRAGRWVRLT